jgi:hypothetical protein
VGAQPPDKALTGPGRTWGDSMINGFDWVATAWRLLESIHWHECSLDARGSACEGAECLVRQIIPPVTGFCPTLCFLQREPRGYFWPQCPGPIASWMHILSPPSQHHDRSLRGRVATIVKNFSMFHLDTGRACIFCDSKVKVRRDSISNYLSPPKKLSCSSSVPNNPRSS